MERCGTLGGVTEAIRNHRRALRNVMEVIRNVPEHYGAFVEYAMDASRWRKHIKGDL